jgi:murein L,D-transpeptidase YcbB/YkuD
VRTFKLPVVLALAFTFSVAIAQDPARPVWVDALGRPTTGAWAVLTHLRAAADEGLDPDDYRGAALAQEAADLAQAGKPPAAGAETFDRGLTASALAFLRDLHLGRVDPRTLAFDLDHAAEPHDFPALLQSAAEADGFDRLVERLRPPFVQYSGLKQMLPAYRERDPARARQIELAMERLRWLPDLEGARLIVVNIPMFHVWGWDEDRAAGVPAIDMAAITGRAASGKTPVFASRVTEIVLNPYWNVPDSIARNEILPALKRDPGYLARNHMEMIPDGDGVRIRQLPGPWNSLGQLKFFFPNAHSVFLHGTPAPQLFRKPRRDFSHGCVRVEDPVALAEWVLQGQEDWSRARILAAIAEGTTRTIRVARTPHIVMFYATAMFAPVEGDVRFADDIYRHDAALESALKARAGRIR